MTNSPQAESKVDLVGVGLNATDMLVPLAVYPTLGSKVEYRTATILPGGQVASTVMACQQWGLKTRYVGKLGNDSFAKLHQAAFSGAGVEAQIITAPEGSSPQSIILVDPNGERTVLCQRDPRLLLQPGELRREWIENARALHVDGFETAAATQAAQWARAAGIPVIADIDEAYTGVELLLENVDYMIASRDFPCRLMQEPSLEAALRKMHERYGHSLSAATLGEEGVLAWDGHEFHHARAYRVPVVDTTGAGDTFHAGFIYGFMRGWPLQRQLDFACAAAALNCTGQGARHIQSLETIEKLIAVGDRYPAPVLTNSTIFV